MIRKTAKLGLAALVLLTGFTAGVAAADAQATQDVQVEDSDATQIDVVTDDHCPIQIESGASTQCAGGAPPNPCTPFSLIC